MENNLVTDLLALLNAGVELLLEVK